MPSLAGALLAMALHERPPTDSGVWLDAPPKPGSVVSAPLVLTGDTQALEGVLKVELHVVRGGSVTSVETYEPDVPVGSVPFSFRWDPAGVAPGKVTVRVVATTLLRGFSAEVEGLVVPAPRKAAAVAPPRRVVVARSAPVVRRAVARPVRRAVAAPVVDTSGRAFGRVAPVLPYVTRPAAPTTPAPAPPYAAPVAAVPVTERSGWVSVAGGLLLLLVCSHLHRLLRPQPVPRER